MSASPFYPVLHNMVESEGVCPICLMDMKETPKYECENGHTMCHRCKPYYFACSVCFNHLNYVPPPEVDSMYNRPPPIHFMPHPMPMPSAPQMDFLDNERGRWGPPTPGPDQNLVYCRYSNFGCWVKVPEYLSEIHETRCQFRPFLEVEHLPTDLPPGDEIVACTYAVVGCNAMMPPWRRSIHEPICSFKERFEALDAGEPEPEPEPEGDENPDELVQCKLKIYGCLVKMPRRRKAVHEEKCNYTKYYKEEDFAEAEEGAEEPEEAAEDPDELVECKLKIYGCMVKMPRRRKAVHEEKCNYVKFYKEEDFEEPEEPDPDSQVDCCWAEHGCRIRPKLHRKEVHEEKCNYRMEECSFKDNGCEETFIRSRRFGHERNCEFRN